MNTDRNYNAMEGGVSSNREVVGKFYESFANFLIPCNALDRLDANRRLLLDLNHITKDNTVLNWIVKVIPFENLSIDFRTGLPTLQAFQSALFLFGITSCNFRLVKGLLDFEAGYQEFFVFSPLPLRQSEWRISRW